VSQSAFSRLVILRHAEATAARADLDDHQRPLTERGRADVSGVARRLDALGWTPDEVHCSDAARTVETWACVEDTLRTGLMPTFSRRLYLAGWVAFCQQVGGARGDTVCVVGHNPGLEEVVELLCGRRVALGTSYAALLQRPPAPWSLAIEPDTWSLVDQVRPEDAD
jgi:phosphohistidine phosphatase